jgi:hypothetical protein
MRSPNMRFSFYPIERIEQGAHRGGADDDDFDPAILPFDLGNEITLEDVSALIPADEFDCYKPGMGSHAHDHLERIKYALVHRFSEYTFDESTQKLQSEDKQVFRSRRIIRETAACLRLIRPTSQYLHLFEGRIGDDGMFCQIGLDTPVDYIANPINQRNFGFRTKDAESLRRFAPLFHKGMEGEFWKFRMSVNMHESGCFQNNDWKAKFFLWTTAVEALFTTQANQGSLVASERIKFLLGANTSIYPPGELVWIYPNPNLTVGDVVGELYCLRNHIAHGDRVPAYYFQKEGRPSPMYGGDRIPRSEMLFEAMSFIIRHSLLSILDGQLIDHFKSNTAADAYFGSHGLTKKALQATNRKIGKCPA